MDTSNPHPFAGPPTRGQGGPARSRHLRGVTAGAGATVGLYLVLRHLAGAAATGAQVLPWLAPPITLVASAGAGMSALEAEHGWALIGALCSTATLAAFVTVRRRAARRRDLSTILFCSFAAVTLAFAAMQRPVPAALAAVAAGAALLLHGPDKNAVASRPHCALVLVPLALGFALRVANLTGKPPGYAEHAAVDHGATFHPAVRRPASRTPSRRPERARPDLEPRRDGPARAGQPRRGARLFRVRRQHDGDPTHVRGAWNPHDPAGVRRRFAPCGGSCGPDLRVPPRGRAMAHLDLALRGHGARAQPAAGPRHVPLSPRDHSARAVAGLPRARRGARALLVPVLTQPDLARHRGSRRFLVVSPHRTRVARRQDDQGAPCGRLLPRRELPGRRRLHSPRPRASGPLGVPGRCQRGVPEPRAALTDGNE